MLNRLWNSLWNKQPSSPSDSETIKLAWEAIKYTHEKLPLGSVNKRSDQDKPNFNEALAQIIKLRKNLTISMTRYMQMAVSTKADLDPFILKVQCMAAVYLDYKVGNCIEQSIVALNFLKNAGVDDVDWCNTDDGDHYFLVINGNVICDPWANDVYPVYEFEKMKIASQDFKYADFVYQVNPTVKPYLAGTPHTLFSTGSAGKPAIENGEFVRANDPLRL